MDPGESALGAAAEVVSEADVDQVIVEDSVAAASGGSSGPQGRVPPTIITEVAPLGPEAPGDPSLGVGSPDGSRRQRTLDRTRAVEAEKSYSETIREAEVHGEEWKEERRGRGARQFEQPAAATAALPAQASASPQASPPEALAPEGPVTVQPSSPSAGTPAASSPSGGEGVTTTSLRRVKELDATLSGAITQECGVKVRTTDAFRLILPKRGGALHKETRLLIVPVSDSRLCEEPISEEVEPLPPTQVGEEPGAVGALAPESPRATAAPVSATTPEVDDGAGTPPGATGDDGGFIELELSFFRAKPKQSTIAKKLGSLPVVHITLATSDGLCQSLEFLGVHQRQYYTQDPSLDAISQNLNESLLKVALEFIFHPSRTRYAKERLVLRECSTCPEARRDRETLLPLMAEEVQRTNEKIRQVSVEYCSSRAQSRTACAVKARSMLVLDENVLLVSPTKASTAKGPNPKSAFKAFGKGFLSGSRSKGKLQDPRSDLPLGASAQASDAASSSAASSSGTRSVSDLSSSAAAVAAASLGSASSSSLSSRPHAEGDSSAEQWAPGQRPLGALDVDAGIPQDAAAFAKLVECGLSKSAAEDLAAEEEEEETDEQGSSLQELASQLFGDGASSTGPPPLQADLMVDEALTDSTKTPSPKASSRGGGAPSESSNNATEDGGELDGGAGGQPATGLRLLQQRRREREVKSKEESDGLVELWMKQRW